MKWFFDMNNPVMRTLSTLADIVILNLLTLLCSLPVVTGGAALAALNDACIRLVRGEDNELARDYFRAFKGNFKKATLAWLLFLLAAALLYIDYLAALAYVPPLRVGIFAIALIELAIAFYFFALLARYENTLKATFQNAVRLAIGFFPRTLIMVVFAVIFWLACFHWFNFGSLVLILVGLSLPVYLNAALLDGVFQKIENNTQK